MAGDHFTVGELKRWIEHFNLPDDAEILYQRIEDVYFDKHGWDKTVIKKHNEFDGESEYVHVQSPIKHPDDNNLYLDAHY